jgi:hypothetical protein
VAPGALDGYRCAYEDRFAIPERAKEQMTGWSPEKAIAMERRHVLEGEERIARQEVLVKEIVQQGHDQLADTANQMLAILRESLELSRDRIRYLEHRYGTAPGER